MKPNYFNNLPDDLWRDDIASQLGPRDWSELRQTSVTWNEMLGPMVQQSMSNLATNLAEEHWNKWFCGESGFFAHMTRLVGEVPAQSQALLATGYIKQQLLRRQQELERTPGAIPFDHAGHEVHRVPRATLWLPSGRMTSRLFSVNEALPGDVRHRLFPDEHAPHAILIESYLCFRGLPQQNLLYAFPSFLSRLRQLLTQAAAGQAADDNSSLARLARLTGRTPAAAGGLCQELFDVLVVDRMRSIWGYGGERLASISRPRDPSPPR